MARKPRDYAAEYRARQERARARGFASYWQERKARAAAKAAGLPPPLRGPLGQLPRETPDGLAISGTTPGGSSWRLGGWVGQGAYFNVEAGDPAPRNLQQIERATLYVEGVGFRVWVGPFDDEFTLADAARELEELYG